MIFSLTGETFAGIRDPVTGGMSNATSHSGTKIGIGEYKAYATDIN